MTEQEMDDLEKRYPELEGFFDDVGRVVVNGVIVSDMNEYMESEEKEQQKQRLIDMMRGDEEIGLYNERIEMSTMPKEKLIDECVQNLVNGAVEDVIMLRVVDYVKAGFSHILTKREQFKMAMDVWGEINYIFGRIYERNTQ